MKELLNKVLNKIDLNEAEMTEAMNSIMEGKVNEPQMASFLTALRMKGETVVEITAAAKVLREKADSLKIDSDTVLDTCGTGGDLTGTYNISTAVSFILAASGVKVAKHGNRSVSSKSGAADVLEELGANLAIDNKKVVKLIEDVNVGFMFAPNFHKAMKYAVPVRKQMGIRTIFNILGPLSNPASATHQLVGAFNPDLTEVMAGVLKNLGLKRAMVVHGKDGMDEITVTDKTKVSELKDGEIKSYEISPEDFGLKISPIDTIVGGDAKVNSKIILDIFDNKEKGPKRDILLLNAGACLYITGKVETIKDGVELAKEIIESGKAKIKLDEFVAATNRA